MHADLTVSLLLNAALLLVLLVILDLTSQHRPVRHAWRWEVLAGLCLGGVGIGLLLSGHTTDTGTIFDTRSILLSLAGLFLGPVPTVVAAVLTAAFRWAQGGVGLPMGLTVIATSAAIGIAWRRWRGSRALADITLPELLAFGLLVHGAMLGATLLLPAAIRVRTALEIGPPLFVIYPAATVLVGLLLARRLRRERLQRQLAESEARYRSLFENNHAVMLLVDPADGTIVDANPAAANYYGWTRDELRRRRMTDINTRDAAEVRAAMARARDGEERCFNFCHRRADGTVRDVEIVSGPITVGDRALLYSIVHDVTERRLIEDRLGRSERLFREIFLANPFPMWVYDRETLRFLAVNDAAVGHYGYTREQFLGLTIRDIRPPEDLPRLQANLARAVRGVEHAGEWRHRLADGRLIDVEITSHVLQFGGRPAELVLAQDISARRAAECAVRESEQRLRLALQASQQGIYDLDVRTGAAIISPEYATMLGYEPAEFRETNDTWLARLHPDDRETVGRVYHDYLAGNRPEYRVEFRQRTRDGAWKWILSLGCVAERDADGRPCRMLGTHTDITARKEAEQQVADALALTEAVFNSSPVGLITYDAFGRTVSANPAAADMVGATVEDLLAQNYHAIASWRDSGLWAAAQRALATRTRVPLVTSLVTTFGRPLFVEATFVPFQFRAEQRLLLLLRDVIRELVLILEETFPRDIEIRRHIAADTPMVCGDTTQLHQVLLNFAVNARDALPQGGVLTLSAGAVTLTERFPTVAGELPPGPYVLLAVRDTGSGMPPDVRDRIFEPFFTTKPQGKGTGLGLPTALGIVRSHGGGIDVQSEPGAGSEFRVYLPALPHEPDETPPPVEPPEVRGEGRCVLVCDDEPSIREIAGVLLRLHGFEVLEAGNGCEALEVFRRPGVRLDAVLIDIMMPLMTGDRAAAEMLRAQPDLPVVFMSGLMEKDTILTALHDLAHPPTALLRKPFSTPELLDTLLRAFAPPTPPAP